MIKQHHRVGLKWGVRRFTDKDVERMREMRARGLGIREVGLIFKCSSSTVCRLTNGTGFNAT